MLQVKAFGPGLKPTGVIVNKQTEFTVDARMAGKGQLKLYAQVWRTPFFIYEIASFILHVAIHTRADMFLYPQRTPKAAPSTSKSLTREMAPFYVCTLLSNPSSTPSLSPGARSTCPTVPSE